MHPISHRKEGKKIAARFRKSICKFCDKKKECGIKLQSRAAIKIIKKA